MELNRTILEAVYQNFRGDFQAGLRSGQNAAAWKNIATLVPSMSSKNVYPWLGQFPKMREFLDERRIKQLTAHSFEIKNKKWETTVSVETETIEDDTFGVYSPMFIEMGIAVAEWPSEMVFNLLKLGESGLCYDGKPFFASDHPHKVEGSVSNLQAGSSAPWYILATNRPLKPLIYQLRKKPNFVRKDREEDDNVFFEDVLIYGSKARGNAGFGLWQLAYKSKAELTADNVKSAMQSMRELTNDEGSDLGVNPNLIVVPPELEFTAKDLFKAERNSAGATNTLNGALEIYITNLVRE